MTAPLTIQTTSQKGQSKSRYKGLVSGIKELENLHGIRRSRQKRYQSGNDLSKEEVSKINSRELDSLVFSHEKFMQCLSLDSLVQADFPSTKPILYRFSGQEIQALKRELIPEEKKILENLVFKISPLKGSRQQTDIWVSIFRNSFIPEKLKGHLLNLYSEIIPTYVLFSEYKSFPKAVRVEVMEKRGTDMECLLEQKSLDTITALGISVDAIGKYHVLASNLKKTRMRVLHEFFTRSFVGRSGDINSRLGYLEEPIIGDIFNSGTDLYSQISNDLYQLSGYFSDDKSWDKEKFLQNLFFGVFHGDTRIENFLYNNGKVSVVDPKFHSGIRLEDLAIIFTDPVFKDCLLTRKEKQRLIGNYLTSYQDSLLPQNLGYERLLQKEEIDKLSEKLLMQVERLELFVCSMYVNTYIARDDFHTARGYLKTMGNNPVIRKDPSSGSFYKLFRKALNESGYRKDLIDTT
ncbi:hypothetical protein GF327_00635 [Candidatus Woesearchaeota archaeon]|nr:hypothetical protein [Candidatus Woesearchaeota archaeon]